MTSERMKIAEKIRVIGTMNLVFAALPLGCAESLRLSVKLFPIK